MNPLQTLVGILGLSTVSGINLYLTVLVVGLAQRLGWVHGLPADLALLAHPAVLVVAGVLFLLEFAADKIPFVTPIWDAVHTVIRPVGGALLALGAATELPPALRVVAMLAGGTIALGTHGSKMGVRLLAHSSPEPTSHSALSVAEDLGVLGLLALVYTHPYIALPVLAALLVGTAFLLPLLLRALGLLLGGLLGAVRSFFLPGRREELPHWVEIKALDLDPAGAATALPCRARRVKGLPRFHLGYLVRAGERWHIVYRRWFRVRSLAFDDGGATPRSFPGLLWDTLVLTRNGKAQVLLVGRAWRHALPAPA